MRTIALSLLILLIASGLHAQIQPPSFKGLRLGMSRADLQRVVDSTPWKVRYGGDLYSTDPEEYCPSDSCWTSFLAPENNAFAVFHEVIIGQDTQHFTVLSVYLKSEYGSVDYMSIPVLVDANHYWLDDVITRLQSALSQKFGKPSFVLSKKDREGKEGGVFSYAVVRWEFGGSRKAPLYGVSLFRSYIQKTATFQTVILFRDLETSRREMAQEEYDRAHPKVRTNF